MARICILTPGQPSSNPRLVKEADALTESGYDVHVICAHWAQWATELDEELISSRPWTCEYVGGHPKKNPTRYYWTRIRHSTSKRVILAMKENMVARRWAFCRVVPELERSASRLPADLYIGHYPETLPAVVNASGKYHAKVGFDAEDFHTSCLRCGRNDSVQDELAEYFESVYLPHCDFVTSSSPQIAKAYAEKYKIREPTTILNVFPLSQRPSEFRYSDNGDPLTLYWFSQTIGANRGLEDIILAMGALQECKIELHLRGVWQPEYQGELLQFADSVGVKSGKIIVHGPGSPDEMVHLAGKFDIGLALEPGRDNNNRIALSNKIFTYLLGGNALIATATESQRVIVEAIGDAGFCYEPGDVNALAGRLKRWYDDRATLEKARCQAWDWGTRRYNWDEEKKKFLQIIQNALTECCN